MQKRFKLQPISILLFVSALTLAGCSHESGSSLPSKQSTIVLKISQGDHIEVVPEDRTFSNLLNKVDALDEKNVPAPQNWHRIKYKREHPLAVQVENCAELDLLELVIYKELDLQGRPKSFQYVAVCGDESEKDCDTRSIVPIKARRIFSDPRMKYFAFSGICISKDRLNARSFISFFEKTNP